MCSFSNLTHRNVLMFVMSTVSLTLAFPLDLILNLLSAPSLFLFPHPSSLPFFPHQSDPSSLSLSLHQFLSLPPTGKRVLLCTMRNSCNREMLRPEQLIRDYDVLYLVSTYVHYCSSYITVIFMSLYFLYHYCIYVTILYT